MQKRIKFQQILSEKHSSFPLIWQNLLRQNQIKQAKQILLRHSCQFMIQVLEIASRLDNIHGLMSLLNDPRTLSYKLQSRQPYAQILTSFLQTLEGMVSRIIQHRETYSLMLLRSHKGKPDIKQHLLTATSNIYMCVIDLKMLGKLVISKNIVEYFNNNHHWKYKVKHHTVDLSKLLPLQRKQQQQQQKMATKISLSIKKYRSHSENNERISGKLKRTNSPSKLNMSTIKKLGNEQNWQRLRVSTEANERYIKNPLKILPSLKNNLPKRENLIQTQQTKPHKTESSHQKSKLSHSRFRLSTQLSIKNKSTRKVSPMSEKELDKVQKRINKVEKARSKLILQSNSKHSHLLKERLKLTRVDSALQKEALNKIFEFVSVKSKKIISNQYFNGFGLAKINQYLQELSNIYLEKQLEIQQNQASKIRLHDELYRYRYGWVINIQTVMKAITTVTQKEQKIFNFYYELVHKFRASFKLLITEYIIYFDDHILFFKKFTEQLKNIGKIAVLPSKLNKPIAILLHQFFSFVSQIQINLLNNVFKKQNKLIAITIVSQTSFQENVLQLVNIFENIFEPIISYIQLFAPKALWLQQHQLQIIGTSKNILHSLLLNCRANFLQNLSKFQNMITITLLSSNYKTEKEAIAMIYQLQDLKYVLDNDLKFKSQIYGQGVLLKLASIKNIYLKQIDNKLTQIFKYFLNIYEHSQAELNNRLKTIIVINVDFLSEYKCQEYRQQIDDNYRNLIESLMLLLNHLNYKLKQSEIINYLRTAYTFKQRIHQNMLNFSQKLIEYKNISNKTIKLLQIKSKSNKQVYQDLSQRLKKLILCFTNEKSIIQYKSEIMSLDHEFMVYNNDNKELIDNMKQNQMVYWQDDQYFADNIQLLKLALQFLEGKGYKNIFTVSIGELTIDEFYSAYNQFAKFITLLEDTKIQKLFKPTYTLINSNLTFAEIMLYKKYTSFELLRSKQLGIDIEGQKGSKMLSVLKRYQNIQKKNFERILQLYQTSRLNDFNLHRHYSYQLINLQKYKGQFNIEFIKNIDEIKQTLKSINSQKSSELLEYLDQLFELYKDLVLLHKIIKLISTNIEMEMEKTEHVLQILRTDFQQLLCLNHDHIHRRKFQQHLQQEKNKHMEMVYIQKINIFSRYALLTIEDILNLDHWKDQTSIQRNIKIMCPHLDGVEFAGTRVKGLIISKDQCIFDKPFDILAAEGQKAKIMYIYIQSFLKESLIHSQNACAYIKILIWCIYFTQQVQLNLMTDIPLTRLRENFQQIICEIASQIRYDIKLHHKSYQIAQINFFISHIDKIMNIKSITDFQWVSTIRYYQKLKVVKVEQNDRVFEYGFELQKPLNINMSYHLQTNISYGFQSSVTYYQISAYILGQSLVIFQNLSLYGFQFNYSLLLNIIKKCGYFVKFIVKQDNYKSINYLHKQIFDLSLKKLELTEQTLKLPIFFQYKNESFLPQCFPEKHRQFSTPEFSYDLTLAILLQINKYQYLFDKCNINKNVLCRAMNYINSIKAMTIKVVTIFMQSLITFLEKDPQPEKQNIFKFVLKYFIVNYGVQDNQLTKLLKDLIIQSNKNNLQYKNQEYRQLIYNFINGDKRELIIYGPPSMKTHSILAMNIPFFNKDTNIQKNQRIVYYLEGLSCFLQIKLKIPPHFLALTRFIIEDRYIYDVEPSELINSVLSYASELNSECIETIFNLRINHLKIDGDYKMLWRIITNFYHIFQKFNKKASLITMMDLIIRSFHQHSEDYVNELQEQQRCLFRLTINKETVKIFMIIAHQIFYYQLHFEERKRFSELMKQLPIIIDEFRTEDISSLTCKGFSCEKIINLIKKQKLNFMNVGNYIKQFILIKKYLSFSQPLILFVSNNLQLRLVKNYIHNLEYNKITIILNGKYRNIFKNNKYRRTLYIVEDIHLADKDNLTFVKKKLEFQKTPDQSFLMIAKNDSFTQVLKDCITFKFVEIEFEQIYKFQSKEGINDSVQQKCRLLENAHFFESHLNFLVFLINITVKLPSQYYKKYFARHLIYTKLVTDSLAVQTIKQTEQFIHTLIDVTSARSYLIDVKDQHNEINSIQIQKKLDNLQKTLTFLQKTIKTKYLEEIIPYVLADKIYIIRQDTSLLPLIITTIHERKHYYLFNIEFIKELITIIDEVYSQQSQITLIVQQPLSSSPEWRYFLEHYLRGLDLINLFEDLKQYVQQLTNKQEYVYRLTEQSNTIKDRIHTIIYSKMKLIISLAGKSHFNFVSSEFYINNIVFLNCILKNEERLSIGMSIIENTLENQSETTRSIINQHKNMISQLILGGLIDLTRLQFFTKDIISNVKQEIYILQKRREMISQRKSLYTSLLQIKEAINIKLNEQQASKKQNKQFLDYLLLKISNPQFQHSNHNINQFFASISYVRDRFMSNQQPNIIQLKQQCYFNFYNQLLSQIFREQLTLKNEIVIFQLKSQTFIDLIQQNRSSKLITILNKYKGIEKFIMFRYSKYLINLMEEYCKVEYSRQIIEHQVRQVNYFYLMDVTIELKKKQEHARQEFQLLLSRKRLIESFTKILVSIEHIDIDQDEMIRYHIFKRLKKLVRSYTIETSQNNSFDILNKHQTKFESIQSQFQQYLLKQEEQSFKKFNKKIIQKKHELIIIDPYNRIENVCNELSIKIIYVNNTTDIQELYDYKFKMTIFCIKIASQDEYYRNKMMIDHCVDIINKKHSDLQENIIEKIAISITKPSILRQIKREFSIINMDISQLQFFNIITENAYNNQFGWYQKKKEYIECKKKIKNQIQLIKNLKQEEIPLYIVKIEQIIHLFQQKHNQIYKISKYKTLKTGNFIAQKQIYKALIELNDRLELPFNFSMRIMKKVNLAQLVQKWEASINYSRKERQQQLKFILLSYRSQVIVELQQCIEQSRFVAVIYQQFNKKQIKQILQSESSGGYIIRMIIEYDEKELMQFEYQTSSFQTRNESLPKQVILIMVKYHQIAKISKILNKCSVLWL